MEVRGFFIKNRSRIPQQAPTGGSHHSVGQGGGRYNTGRGVLLIFKSTILFGKRIKISSEKK